MDVAKLRKKSEWIGCLGGDWGEGCINVAEKAHLEIRE